MTAAMTNPITLGQVIRANVVTKQALIGEVSVNRGARPVTIKTITDPNGMFNKKDNPFWNVTEQRWKIRKVATINGFINFNYENAVNRQRQREGITATFQSLPRKWGLHIKGTPLVVHIKDGDEKHYLEVKVEKSLAWELIHVATSQPLDAAELALVNRWLKPKSKSRQGVQKEIVLRDYDLDSIIGLTVDGKGFRFVV